MNDTTALQERIARAIHLDDLQAGEAEPWGANEYLTAWYRRNAAAVLPIVEAEVRAAKAEALREMQEHHEREADKAQTSTARAVHLTVADCARKHAIEYETGDRA